jgi:hypothetical protein
MIDSSLKCTNMLNANTLHLKCTNHVWCFGKHLTLGLTDHLESDKSNQPHKSY